MAPKKSSNSSNTQPRVKWNKIEPRIKDAGEEKHNFFYVTRFSDSISPVSVYSLLTFTPRNSDSLRRHFCWTHDTTQEMIKVVISHSSARNRKRGRKSTEQQHKKLATNWIKRISNKHSHPFRAWAAALVVSRWLFCTISSIRFCGFIYAKWPHKL